jgi:hypothetical protein
VTLRGALGTLGLAEVAGLIAATGKTGELYVAGNRTAGLARMPAVQGRLWFDAGRFAAADVGGVTDLVDAVVDLLWLVEGTFTFRLGPAPTVGLHADVTDVLGEAQARQTEWREIERVLPSQRAWLELNPDPRSRHVTLRADQWRVVVAVAGGQSVAAAVGHLGLGELPGCRAIKEVVDAGLITVRAGGPSVGGEAVVIDLAGHVEDIRPDTVNLAATEPVSGDGPAGRLGRPAGRSRATP